MGRSRGEYHIERCCTRTGTRLTDSLRHNAVLSFMSAFGNAPRSPTSTSAPANDQLDRRDIHTSSSPQHSAGPARDSPTPTRPRTERPSSRPMSVVQAYQPPLMEIAQDTLPELQPIFTFLNSHSNKLYQEGYFLKLNDLDSREAKTVSERVSTITRVLTTLQKGDHTPIERGLNALPSLWVRFCRCGMLQL